MRYMRRHVAAGLLLLLLVFTFFAAQCGGPSNSGPRPVSISGTARLYEGDDCSATNLRDERDFRFTVESGETESLLFDLKAEAGDTAQITLEASNEVDVSGSQLVVASGAMDIEDDEDILPNEYKTVRFNGQAAVNSTQPKMVVDSSGCAGDEVRTEVEVFAAIRPAPPAEAADPDLILQPDTPECETRCTSLGETQEKCSASICAGGEYPLLALRSIDSWDKAPGDDVELLGGFGIQADIISVALAEERDGRLYHRYRLGVLSWTNDRIMATVHQEVNEGLYQILLVYQVNLGKGARPVYMKGSNTLPISVRSP